MVAAFLPASWLLLFTLLLIGFGSLGQFPIYYALSQELSAQQDGEDHGRAELPHLDCHRAGPEADRPVDRPDALLFPGHVPRRTGASCGLPGARDALECRDARKRLIQEFIKYWAMKLLRPRFTVRQMLIERIFLSMNYQVYHNAAIVACLVLLASTVAGAEPPPTRPRSPRDEQAAFVLADPSLAIELVAAEPEVTSPVAIAWDEDGRLYVAEMIDYPVAPAAGPDTATRGSRW